MTAPDDNRPRLMTKEDAAAYCGVCAITFGNWVTSGIMPRPFRSTRMYDRLAIEAAIDRDSGILRATAPEESALERWQREQAERKAEDPFDRWEREQATKATAPESSYDKWQRESLARRARKVERARAAARKAAT
jgi:hypothetical protein